MKSDFKSTFIVVFNYLKSDLIKNQRTFKIGLVTIFLVVLFTSLFINTINLSSLIFLRLAENQVGETDLIMIPFSSKDAKNKRSAFDKLLNGSIDLENNFTDNYLPLNLMDFPEISKKLIEEPYIKGISPRWIFPVNTSKDDFWASSNLVVLNSRIENQYEFGRNLNLSDLNYLECYLSFSLLKSLMLDENLLKTKDEFIDIKVNLLNIFNKLNQIQDITIHREDDVKNKSNGKKNPSKTNENEDMLNNNGYLNLNKLVENNPLLKNLTISINSTEILKKLSYYNFPEIISFPLDQTYNLIYPNSSKFDMKYLIFDNLVESFFNKNGSSNNSHYSKFIYFEPLNHSLIFNTTSYKLNLKTDEQLITFNVSRFIQMTQKEDNLSSLNFELRLKVKDIVPSVNGKWPFALGNVIAIDSAYGKEYIISNMKNIVAKIFKDLFNITVDTSEFEANLQKRFEGFNLDKYALIINILLKDKFNLYGTSNDVRRHNIVKSADKLIAKLGYDFPVSIESPVYESFSQINTVKIFMDNIFYSVTFFLVILSTILIYSLMLGNVDERNYEFGILRALGFNKQNLIIVILFQALIFSIPAIIISLVVTYILNVIISIFLFEFSGLSFSFTLFSSTVYWSLISGITIPLVSSYLPIKKALSENLKEALTIFNKKVTDISINIVKLEKLGVSPAAIITSLVMIIMGFSTYYLAPLCFLLSNYTMFLFILNTILIFMIIGLILVMQIIVPYLEKAILYIIMLVIRSDRNIKFVVLKNLEGHSRRNSKTSIMFMIALSFVIFAGCTIELISDFITNISKNIFGADIWLKHNSIDDSLHEKKLTNYLKDFDIKFPGNLKNFSFTTFELNNMLHSPIYFSNLCGYPSKGIKIVGVPENMLYSTYSEIYSYSELNSKLNFSSNSNFNKVLKDNGGYDVISGLYLNKEKSYFHNFTDNKLIFPSMNNEKENSNFILIVVTLNDRDLLIIISEGWRKELAVSPETRSFVVFGKNTPRIGYSAKVVSMQIKISGFLFSSYSIASQNSRALISMEQINLIMENEFNRNPDLKKEYMNSKYYEKVYDYTRKNTLFIKFNKNTTRMIKDIAIMEIRNLINSDNTQLVNTDDFLESAEKSSNILEMFFILIGLIALVLSFFLIWISFNANIRENICEFGIIRAIGLSKEQTMRVYLYEATVLILSSIIVGTLIGIVISNTLVLQFNLFTEFPFRIFFPYKLYLTLSICGFLLALLGSYYPTAQINRLSLVKILKGIVDA